MHDIVNNYLLYEPKIKILTTGKIYTITLNEERAYEKSFMRLSSFLLVKDDIEWKILLRPMYSFSKEEMSDIGVKYSTSGNKQKFILPTGTHLESQLIFQKCYKAHADIFNLIDIDVALDIGNNMY